MNVIYASSERVRPFLTGERPESVKPSYYNVVVPHSDIYLAFNLYTKSYVILSKEENDALNYTSKPFANLSDIERILFENGLLVPEEINEQDRYIATSYYLAVTDTADFINSYTILTTTGCNARCFYCFEQDFIAESMTDITAKKTAEFIINNCKGRKVSIHWFGGEPLCNQSAINTICGLLKDHQIDYTTSMTTNGSLANEDVCFHASKEWNLNHVQITLDGMDSEHNRRKNYKGTIENPFASTISNIHSFLNNGISVSIRINYDLDNAEDILNLISFLTKEFKDEHLLKIYPSQLYEECGGVKKTTNEIRNKLMYYQNEFFDILLASGFYHRHPVKNDFNTAHCGSNNKHHRTVGPSGKFLICHNISDSKNYGSVFCGITDPDLFSKWMENYNLREKCDGCRYLPSCTLFDQCPTVRTFCCDDQHFLLEKSIIERFHRIKKVL